MNNLLYMIYCATDGTRTNYKYNIGVWMISSFFRFLIINFLLLMGHGQLFGYHPLSEYSFYWITVLFISCPHPPRYLNIRFYPYV